MSFKKDITIILIQYDNVIGWLYNDITKSVKEIHKLTKYPTEENNLLIKEARLLIGAKKITLKRLKNERFNLYESQRVSKLPDPLAILIQ